MTHIARQSVALGLLSSSLLLLAVGCEVEQEAFAEEDSDHGPAFVAEAGGLLDQLTPTENGWRVAPRLDSDVAFRRVGIRFDAFSVVDIEARFSDDGELWSDWLPVTLTYQDRIAHNAHIDTPFPATGAEVRFRAPMEAELSFVAVELIEYFVDAEPTGEGSLDVEAVGESEQALAADGVAISRSQWGARQRNCGSSHSPNKLTIHHTYTPNNDTVSMPARIRQIQAYHIDSRGWCDIGYHFLVGQDGQVYQGRYENKTGAHAAGANTNNVGISFVGDFSNVAPSQAMMDAAARIMNAMVNTYGIQRNRSRIKGHREVGSTSTACPGQQLFNRLENLIDLSTTVSPGEPVPNEGDDSTPDAPPAPGCYSSTLGASVDHDSCVQVTYAGCGLGECAWYHCNAGSWQCINRESCDDDSAYANDACEAPEPEPAPPPPSASNCYSSTLDENVATGTCVQVTYAGCGQNGCQWYRCQEGSWQCTQRDGCDDDLARANDHCAPVVEEPEPPPGFTQSYADVPPGHWAFESAEMLREVGAMWGCAQGQFCPDQLVTRAEVAYLFSQLWDGSVSIPVAPLFDDVSTDMWMFDAVQEMSVRGITYGCGDGNFCPWEPMSRGAAAVFLRRAENLSNSSSTSSFVDVDTTHWAFDAIEAAYDAGYVVGCSSSPLKYCPGDMMTRAEAAVLFSRVYLD